MKSFLQKSVVETTAIHSLRNHPAQIRWFLLLLGLYLAGISAGRAQSFNWTVKNSSQAGHRTQVAADNAGNTYVTTAFTGTITLGGATLKSNGGVDILLIKYKPDGTVQWARRIGSPADEQAGDVAVSFSGEYVYVTGTFQSTVRFDDYHGLLGDSFASAGGTDAFVARYGTATGTFKWAKRAGGPQHEKGNGLAVDGLDNVYATGSFQGKAVFQTGLVPFSLTSAGMSDIFLTKYTPSGGVMFARRLGNTGIDEGKAVALDKASGEIYLTGGFAPPANLFIPDVLIARFNPKGNLVWTRTAGRANEVD
ncbi:MAG: hypothetical protein ICV83_34245, partial [Cytophagales bacterium]|nr:hypothetical protein [Cytophagales bacterium]